MIHTCCTVESKQGKDGQDPQQLKQYRAGDGNIMLRGSGCVWFTVDLGLFMFEIDFRTFGLGRLRDHAHNTTKHVFHIIYIYISICIMCKNMQMIVYAVYEYAHRSFTAAFQNSKTDWAAKKEFPDASVASDELELEPRCRKFDSMSHLRGSSTQTWKMVNYGAENAWRLHFTGW